MPWSRIDDQFPDHPKVVSGGPLAELLQVRAICYANRHLSDGVIPAGMVPKLTHDFDRLILDGTDAHTIDWADVMVKHGLWERDGAGYRIHDFLVYNLAKADVLAMRESRKRAGRLGGQASVEARASRFGSAAPRANAEARASRPASSLKQVLHHVEASAQANHEPRSRTPTTITSPGAQAPASHLASPHLVPIPRQEIEAMENLVEREHTNWTSRQIRDEAERRLGAVSR